MKKTTQRLKGNQFITLGLPATGIALCLLLIISASAPHDAELRFTEFSDRQEVLGGMLPASCESGGNDLVGPDHVTACSWTTYCTGQNDPNQFQWWQYSNDDSIDYVYTGYSCAPTVWTDYCTGPNDPNVWQNWAYGYDGGGGGPWYISRGTSCRPVPTVDVNFQ
jgi:hypothetical protein